MTLQHIFEVVEEYDDDGDEMMVMVKMVKMMMVKRIAARWSRKRNRSVVATAAVILLRSTLALQHL